MYPQPQLDRLTARKVLLRQTIGRRRAATVIAFASVGQPLAWLDRAYALWRRIPLLLKAAALPLGWMLPRPFGQRHGILRLLSHWGPLLFVTIRGFLHRRTQTHS